MRLNTTGVVIAFHGCDAVTRDAILTGELPELQPSANPYDWLGPGLYFFESDAKRAMIFAVTAAANPDKRYSRRPIANPAVLGAVLRVGNWLDMSTQQGISEFKSAMESVFQSRAKPPKNKEAFDGDPDLLLRRLDKAVFVEIHRRREAANLLKYDAVRSPFSQGSPLAEDCRFTEHAHIQIALRNQNAIIGWFLPSGDRLLTGNELHYAKARLEALSSHLG